MKQTIIPYMPKKKDPVGFEYKQGQVPIKQETKRQKSLKSEEEKQMEDTAGFKGTKISAMRDLDRTQKDKKRSDTNNTIKEEEEDK